MSEILTSEISTKIICRTSWTDLNPGRRFDACDKNWNSRRGMHYFEWVDNETCPRGKQVVPSLLRRLRAMEEEGRAQEEQLRYVEEKKKELQQKLKEMFQEKKVLEWGHGQRQLIMWVSLILSWGLFITFVMNGKL
ncbi:unnamed protein product [Prunus armeniaca]|uniref:Zinc finger GRF-type domain-containing protein n=1 Tax=Prunus armeniaca TaxID=36596 RepID=A0A6J5XRY8_PRUAR|nr:hypothetical protein GBA52_024913 [Prunus armeniaca]CAB4316479.1 unnamed protein product [Prunus armeniaca]